MQKLCSRAVLCFLAVFMCLNASALGENTGRGDLTERFGDVAVIMDGGIAYRVRGRISTVLVMGTVCGQNPEAPEESTAEMMYLLVLDDDTKTYAPVRLDSAMRVQWLGDETQPAGEIQLRELYAKGENPNEGCELIVQALNGILPAELISSYAALDLECLTVLDGIEPGDVYVEEEYKSRLRAIKKHAEQSATGEVNRMFNALSGYIVTNMKSGALMKIVDKADRYDGQPTVQLPVIEEILQDGTIQVSLDENALLPTILNVFYEEYVGW